MRVISASAVSTGMASSAVIADGCCSITSEVRGLKSRQNASSTDCHCARPPDTSSSDCTSRCSSTGWRKFGDDTNVPSPIRSVTSAAAVSVGIVAYHGESGSPAQTRWS